MRDDYLKAATAIIGNPNILINLVSRRVKQLKAGARPLVDSLENLDNEDIALREIIEGKITYQLSMSSNGNDVSWQEQKKTEVSQVI